MTARVPSGSMSYTVTAGSKEAPCNVKGSVLGEPYDVSFAPGKHSPKNEAEEAALDTLVALGAAKQTKES